MSADQVLVLHHPLLHEIRAHQAGMRAIPEVIARHPELTRYKGQRDEASRKAARELAQMAQEDELR